MKSKKLDKSHDKINRKEAIHRIGGYGKYVVLTALGTYMLLHPKSAQASSLEDPGSGF